MKSERMIFERSFEELKENRLLDTTNLLRVQIDLFINILKEVEENLQGERGTSQFKSAYYGTEKTLSEAGRDLIYSILDSMDHEWERHILKLLHYVEQENARKLRFLEEKLVHRIDMFSHEVSQAQVSAGNQLDRLRTELKERVEEADRHRQDLIKTLHTIVRQDMERQGGKSPTDPIHEPQE